MTKTHAKSHAPSAGDPRAATDAPGADAWNELQRGAVVVPMPSVGAVRLTGPDRVDFLNGQFANDVRALPEGGSLRSLYLDVKGHALAEARVQRRSDDVHVAVEDGAAGEVLARLTAHRVFDDVELTDLSDLLVCLTVQGPRAAEVIEGAFGAAPPERDDRFVQVARDGGDLLLLPHRRTLPGGFDVHVLRKDAEVVTAALREAGAALGDVAALEASRVEAGLPRATADAGSGVLPQEAGLDGAISTRKGCYLGQETMARIEARARLRRGLVRLRFDGPHDAGGERPDVLLDGRVVGRLGTRASHPELGPIALAVVRSDLPPDAPLDVAGTPVAILSP